MSFWTKLWRSIKLAVLFYVLLGASLWGLWLVVEEW
jgi:hypothetical protein